MTSDVTVHIYIIHCFSQVKRTLSNSNILSFCYFGNIGASEMAQQVKELGARSSDLSSIPGAHMVEGESSPPKVV